MALFVKIVSSIIIICLLLSGCVPPQLPNITPPPDIEKISGDISYLDDYATQVQTTHPDVSIGLKQLKTKLLNHLKDTTIYINTLSTHIAAQDKQIKYWQDKYEDSQGWLKRKLDWLSIIVIAGAGVGIFAGLWLGNFRISGAGLIAAIVVISMSALFGWIMVHLTWIIISGGSILLLWFILEFGVHKSVRKALFSGDNNVESNS